jgi:uncharacterized protein (TIGR02231 family)
MPLLLPGLGATALCGAEPIRAESSISHVTVYIDRAIVTRDAAVELPVGTQEVLFAGLPVSLDPDLLQVAGDGEAEVMILEVRAVDAQLAVPANARLKELQEQVRTLQGELRTLNDRSGVLQARRDFLERVKVAATTPPGKDGGTLPSVDQWERLVTFYAESITQLGPQLQEIDTAKEEVQSRLSAVQREIANLQPQSARAVKDVFVRVDVTKAGPMRLALTYTVAGASWGPTYDVRVTSAEKSLSLGYAAMVRQSTGEDWHAVSLTLSTARPAIGGTPPELTPWYVREQQPMPLRRERDTLAGFRAPAEAAADSMVEEERKAMRAPLPSAAAAVQTGLTAATFAIPHAAEIPADNAPHKVPIAAIALEATLTHLAIPKLAEYAYLQAAVINTSEYPLISGPVNMYLDGTFVARSHLETVMPAEKFDLDLGVDDGVAVERKLINRHVEDTGLVSRKQKTTYSFRTTIQNNRPNAIDVIVQDQLPVSQHERIVIELETPRSREVKQDDDGTLTWTFSLAPGEKRELPLAFSVEHPTDLPVEGLE